MAFVRHFLPLTIALVSHFPSVKFVLSADDNNAGGPMFSAFDLFKAAALDYWHACRMEESFPFSVKRDEHQHRAHALHVGQRVRRAA